MKIFLRQNHSSKKWIFPYLTRALAIALLLILGQISFAQNTSAKGRFEVDHIAGCAPLTVNLTDLGTVVDNSAPILVHFNRDPADPESLSGILNSMTTGGSLDTTYTAPGTYLIGQVNGNVADPNDRFDFITVVVTEAVSPTFSVSTCTNNNIIVDIDFSMDNYDGYFIDFGDGQNTTITKSDPNQVNHVYASQNTYNITVTGQLSNGTSVACGTAIRPVTTIVNLPIPQITELSVQSPNSAMLSYSTLDTNISYALEIDDGSGFSNFVTLVAANEPNGFLIDDTNLDFENNTYTIRIMASEACGNSTDFSNEVPSIALTYGASYVGNQIDVGFDWTTSPTGLTAIFLLQDGNIVANNMDAIGQYVVSLTNCQDALSFQIEGNFNGAASLSLVQNPDLNGVLTPPPLNVPEIIFSGGELLVRWEPPTVNAASYNIYRQESDLTYSLVGNSNNLQYVDAGLNASTRQVCYRVTYVDGCGNESEQSPEICEDLSNQILIPNVFTPNGDGVNDIFRVADGVYRNFEFYIYNRWGSLVFGTSNSASGWDGRVNGQLAPTGTYIYRIQYFDVDDRLTSLSGSFLLIR